MPVETESQSQSVSSPMGKNDAPHAPRRVAETLERFGLLLLLVLLVIFFSILLPDTFPTQFNARAIGQSQSVSAVVALALLFPLVCGRFDLSVGSNVGLVAVLVAGMMSRNDLSLLEATAVGLFAGLIIGGVNGALVTVFGINSLICTIGTGTALGGLTLAYTNGIPISSGLSPTLTDLSLQSLGGVPALMVIMLVFAGVCWLVFAKSVYGRQLRSIGSNEPAAFMTGVPVRRTVFLSFVISGFLGACAGVLQIALQGNGNPLSGGLPFMLPALAAVFLGATTLIPGTYNVPGTVLSLFFLGTAVSGLTFLGIQPWVNDLFNGSIVVLAVGFSAYFRRRRTGVGSLGD